MYIPDERKVPLLLTVIGALAYGVLHNLMAPENPKTKSYAELVTALKQHYEPKPLVIAELLPSGPETRRDRRGVRC